MVFVSYTDNTVQMFDPRMANQASTFRTGGHSCLVKSIFVGNDETVVFTGGMDGTLRLWDVGKQAVIKVYGTDDKENPVDYAFHDQTIWSILPDVEDPSTIWTGGRDGKIFVTDIEEGKARPLLD